MQSVMADLDRQPDKEKIMNYARDCIEFINESLTCFHAAKEIARRLEEAGYVFLKEQPDQIIGTVCLHDIIKPFYHTCEIGYKFSSQFHGNGYAFEAIDRCIYTAFEELVLHRITAMVCRGNERSMHLLDCLGFRMDGILRDYLILGGEWQDHALYSLLRTDPRNDYTLR